MLELCTFVEEVSYQKQMICEEGFWSQGLMMTRFPNLSLNYHPKQNTARQMIKVLLWKDGNFDPLMWRQLYVWKSLNLFHKSLKNSNLELRNLKEVIYLERVWGTNYKEQVWAFLEVVKLESHQQNKNWKHYNSETTYLQLKHSNLFLIDISIIDY